MRIRLATAAAALFCLAAGCNGTSSPVAAGAAPPIPTNVGPIPGATEAMVQHPNPYANDPVALAEGRRLFLWYNCVGCHGGHGGGGMGPSLRRPEKLFGNRDDQIFDSIAQGRSEGMPAWGTKIPESQIWQLVSYIKSMRTPQEPDPPTEPANEQVPNPENNNVTVAGTQGPR